MTAMRCRHQMCQEGGLCTVHDLIITGPQPITIAASPRAKEQLVKQYQTANSKVPRPHKSTKDHLGHDLSCVEDFEFPLLTQVPSSISF